MIVTDRSNVAVATITWVRTAGEQTRLRESLSALAAAGFAVAVADRGSSARFTQFLKGLPGFSVTVPATHGLVPQVKASVDVAALAETPFILYVEPDKQSFFDGPLSEFIRRVPEQGDLGVVLAARSEASFNTYPPMQRYTEGVINHLCAGITRRPGDYSYGPLLMNRCLLPQIAQIDDRLGWGWRPHTVLTAHRQRLGVLHLTDDYPCPPDQREEDDAECEHRLRQLSQNILGLVD